MRYQKHGRLQEAENVSLPSKHAIGHHHYDSSVEDFYFYGNLTDLNVWTRALTDADMVKFTKAEENNETFPNNTGRI